MTLEAVERFWPTILRHQESLLRSQALPLLGLRGLESVFELQPLESSAAPSPSADPEPGKYPGFSRVTEREITVLRSLIHSQSSSTAPARWAERLLRFCELHLATLHRRSTEAHGSAAAVRSLHVQIVALFLDRYLICKDVRLLNTALKLSEMAWTRSTLSPASADALLVSAALCARNRLLIAQALRELDAA